MDLRVPVWTWQLTPAEMLGGFRYAQARRIIAKVETAPFPSAVPRRPFPGLPGFTFQVALGDLSVSDDVELLCLAHPELVIPGRRSGILAFRGDELVGGLVVQGFKANDGRMMVVRPDCRGVGLSRHLLIEWGWHIKRVPVLREQFITVASVRALMGAHTVVVERAVAAGMPVPPRVVLAVRDGHEAARLIASAMTVDNLGPVVQSTPEG